MLVFYTSELLMFVLYTYRKQHGRLKVCSHSILFDPLDIRHPVIKVCYKHCGVIKEYHDTTGSLRLINHLVCSYAMHIAMKLLRLKLPSFLRFSCHVCTYTLQIDVVCLLYCMVATCSWKFFCKYVCVWLTTNLLWFIWYISGM